MSYPCQHSQVLLHEESPSLQKAMHLKSIFTANTKPNARDQQPLAKHHCYLLLQLAPMRVAAACSSIFYSAPSRPVQHCCCCCWPSKVGLCCSQCIMPQPVQRCTAAWASESCKSCCCCALALLLQQSLSPARHALPARHAEKQQQQRHIVTNGHDRPHDRHTNTQPPLVKHSATHMQLFSHMLGPTAVLPTFNITVFTFQAD
jgi:hypothetical protein